MESTHCGMTRTLAEVNGAQALPFVHRQRPQQRTLIATCPHFDQNNQNLTSLNPSSGLEMCATSYNKDATQKMDIQMACTDSKVGHCLARYLPQPLASNVLMGPGPFFGQRRPRVVKPLLPGTHPIVALYDQKTVLLDHSTIRQEIRHLLNNSRHDWYMACVFRLALADVEAEPNDEGNVTVFITVRPGSMTLEQAKKLVQQIGGVLAK